MRPTRRALLGFLIGSPAAALGACSPSPVISGEPAEPWTPPPAEPDQDPSAARAAEWVARTRLLAGAVGAGDWGAGAVVRSDAQLDRLLALDPLIGGTERVFEVPDPHEAPPTDETATAATIDAHADAGVELFRELTSGAADQPTRMLHASLGATAAADRLRALAPVPGSGAPIRFPETTPEASLGVALTHVWALLFGVELALGRLPEGEGHSRAVERLARARELRNLLRDALGSEHPQQEVSYEMPNPMSTAEEVLSALTQLELRLLDALVRLVASAPDGDWYDEMTGQVSWVQRWGGTLPTWPGWTEL